jgi:UDP-N-acetylmuramoylalanine--D-glutamate ligase
MNSWTGRRVCVAGLGVSGAAAARVLIELGASVVAVDATAVPDRDAELADLGVEVRTGTPPETHWGAELVVTSPGWRPDHPLLVAAQADGLEVIGEPELAWRLRVPRGDGRMAPWVAVTGTNGKTTTVGMVAEILTAAGQRTLAVGNVGVPVVQAVRDPSYDVLAVELSSFQLHWSRDLAPDAGVLLNVADDHLDWHGDLAAYAAAKTRVWRGNGCGAYNADDDLVARLAGEQLDCGHPFTLGETPSGGFGVVEGVLTDRMAGWSPDEPEPSLRNGGVELVRVDELAVHGPHNVANALAAAAVTRVLGLRAEVPVPWQAVGAGLRSYRPGAHRNTEVGEIDGVRYVDDSKATNPHAADASLSSYASVVWIAGGLLKGADVTPLVQAHAARLRGVVLIGRDKSVIADALARHAADVPVVVVDATDTGAMDTAVRAAAELAEPGDVVLLAPAAASMDMFRDYAQRGEVFAAAVQARSPRQ